MSESEIRRRIEEYLRKRMLPAAALGLALTGCGEDLTTKYMAPLYMAPEPDSGVVADAALYAAPVPDAADAVRYAAPLPDAGEPVVLYAAPVPDAGDSTERYAAPMPDGGQ